MISALFKFLPSWFYAHCVKCLYFDVILGSGGRSIYCPLHTLWCLDLVAITPISSGVLHIVVKYELIHGCDHVEIAFPFYIADWRMAIFYMFSLLLSLRELNLILNIMLVTGCEIDGFFESINTLLHQF